MDNKTCTVQMSCSTKLCSGCKHDNICKSRLLETMLGMIRLDTFNIELPFELPI